MKKMKRITAILLVLVICIAISACGGNQTAAPATDNGGVAPSSANTPSGSSAPASQTPPPIITQAVPEPAPVNARFADNVSVIITTQISAVNLYSPGGSNAACQYVYYMIYDRLLEYLGEGEYGPALATSYETSDYKTFTFKLRDDVLFTNGDKFTAEDVINTIQLGKDTQGVLANDYWRAVDTATVLDEYTVQIVLSDVSVDFLYTITMPSAGIVDKKAIDADEETGMWVGTGLFTIETLAPADYITLVRNDNYWGEPAVSPSVTFRYVSDVTARSIMLQNGEITMCLEVAPEDRFFFMDNDDFYVLPCVNNNIWYISFNMTDSITGDYNFRRAVAHAINREEMMIASMGDQGIPEEVGTIYGYATEFRNNDIPLLPYDLDLAKEYLAKSGYNGEEIEISFSVELISNAVEMLVYQLSQIGVPAKINKMDSAALSNYTFGAVNQSQIVVSTCSPALTPINYSSIVGGGGGLNRAAYNNPTVNEMLDRAPSIIDVKEREAVYYQIQELVSEDLPYLSTFYRVSYFICAKGLGGMVVHNDLYHDFRYVFQTLEG